MDLELLLRTSGLLLTALVLTRLSSRATAASRHLIWHAAIIAVLLAPVAAPFVPHFSIPLPSQMRVTVTESESGSPPLEPVSFSAETLADGNVVASLPTLIAGGTWIVGAWFLFGWFASAWQAARATPARLEWLAHSQRLGARLGVSPMIPVRQSPDAGSRSPKVVGLFKPVIILPSAAIDWSPPDREAALLHELSHIRRADRRTQALAQAACAIYWFNPLVWMAAAALARERERACDEEVLRAGVRPSAYASLLLSLAKGTHEWTPAAALGMARPSTIEGRLLAILAKDSENSAAPSQRRVGAGHAARWFVITGWAVIVSAILGAQQRPLGMAARPPSSDASQPTSTVLLGLDDREQPHSITKALTRALDDPDRQVREHAALGLALVPGTETIDPLLTALRDSDAQVREKAAIGLAFRRDARIVDPLLNAMSDTDAQVREKVAIALGASGDARARRVLEKALSDPNPRVREKAASGLILLGLRK